MLSSASSALPLNASTANIIRGVSVLGAFASSKKECYFVSATIFIPLVIVDAHFHQTFQRI
jgi:hypothetical protein